MNIAVILISISLLMVLSAFFSATETAFMSLKPVRIKQFSKSSKKSLARNAKKVLEINKHSSKFLSTILVSNNIVNILGSSLMTYLFTIVLMYQEAGVLYSTIVFSIIIITFGEILPKIIARAIPEKIALFSASILRALMFILTPITFLFRGIDRRLSERFEEERITATEDELLEIVETIEKEGVLEHGESELIQSAITFDDVSVKTAMTVREIVLVIKKDATFEEIAKTFKENRYSRIPVYDKESDSIVGILYQRDIYNAFYNKEKCTINDLMNEPIYISHRRLIPFALQHLQKSKQHMAVVVDNLKDKKFLGIITLEDIMEELVGEIYDEYDEYPKSVFEIGNHMYHVSGKVLLDYFFDNYIDDVEFPKTKATTMDGWLKELVGEIGKNDIIYYENLKITVLSLVKENIEAIEVEVLTDYSED